MKDLKVSFAGNYHNKSIKHLKKVKANLEKSNIMIKSAQAENVEQMDRLQTNITYLNVLNELNDVILDEINKILGELEK
jgi:hypothetical protein